MKSSINDLKISINELKNANKWGEVHTAKDLAIALNIETSEVLEHFLWLKEGDNIANIEELGYELADVLIYLIQLADFLEIDLIKEAETKAIKNKSRFMGNYETN